ncbi:protein kinase [Glycomyces sp. NPDC048151]|uniref:protein kinase domain-containing protein n=1 Tax=Glycomyces sp. NPDC048151 TaxID=3364002 RepID=UPI00371C811F
MDNPLLADRYLLQSSLGAGGMGEVWRAHDERLDRDVAVKLLYQRGHEEPGLARARFLREAQALAKLKSPGIVAVHDQGEAEYRGETAAYMVMELVDGESLSSLLRTEQRLPAERTMAVVADVADALAVAHRAGIVHRDIKPANIVIALDGTVKLVDFGIARVDGATTLTESGVSLGTLRNASPEQVGFEAVVPASDIYSLGTVAYECLTGRPVFEFPDAKSMIAAHMTAEPAPPGDGVPPAVAQVVLRALAKAPADRWPSAEAFAQACRETAAPDTTAVLRPAVQPLVEREAPARQGMWSWRVGMVTVIVAALLLLTGLFAWSPLTDGWDSQADGDATTEPVPTGAASNSPSAEGSSATSADETTTAAAEPAGSDDGGDAAEDDGAAQDDDQTQDSAETTPPAEEPATSGTMPNVLGMSTQDAKAELAAAGFDNVAGEITDYYDTSHCEVLNQEPAGNAEADFGTRIVLTYMVQGEDDCGL